MDDKAFVKIAKSLADPTRRQLVEMLRTSGRVSCSQVCERFPRLSQPTISHHIKSLEVAGVITIQRAGQFHLLTLDHASLREFAEACLGESHGANLGG